MKKILNQIYETLSHIVQLHECSPMAIRKYMIELKKLIDELPDEETQIEMPTFHADSGEIYKWNGEKWLQVGIMDKP